jgi:hypothetical protein
MTIAEHFANGRQVNPKVDLFDDGVRPRIIKEFLSAYGVAGPFDQGDEEIHRPTAEPDGFIALTQNFLRPKERIGSKLKHSLMNIERWTAHNSSPLPTAPFDVSPFEKIVQPARSEQAG